MEEQEKHTNIHHLYVNAQEAAYDERDEELTTDSSNEPAEQVDLYAPEMYFNRELSWVDFNWRVLNEALDEKNPLLERMKFLAITASNLDEFFMIRVAGLRQQIELGVTDLPPDGMTPSEVLDKIFESISLMMFEMSQCYLNEIVPGLREEGVYIHTHAELDKEAKEWCRRYFYETVFQVLTPLAIDPGHPFPHLLNRSLNLMMTIRDKVTDEERIAVVQVPPVLPRLVKIPTYQSGHHYVLLGEIIAENTDYLFPGLELEECSMFRVTRDADLEIADDEASDLLKTIEEQLRRRRWGAVVRVELAKAMPAKTRERLQSAMRLEDRDMYEIEGPLHLADFMPLLKLDLPHLKDETFTPRISTQLKGIEDIFSAVRQDDILLHHPFDSFSSVVEFIENAADDPDVLAIKQTLYRTSGDSLIVQALARAAENGKQVTAFVELKARFDEENNIVWARQLERAGVHVVYGILGLKTHCKVALVVRREQDGIRTYVHMGTGNYNETTARLYTDFGMLTSRPEIGYEATALFNYLTGYSHQQNWKELVVSPISMRQHVLNSIQREIETHSEETPGYILAKMNSLVDAQVIRALYRASQAGVKVDLVIRGICCLKPGIPGVSENITVKSIVGRFLEHSRMMVFHNGGDTEIYLSSADWMPRNLNRRVEVKFRVESPRLKRWLLDDIIPLYLKDNLKSWHLSPNGVYRKQLVRDQTAHMNSQEEFVRMAEASFREDELQEMD
ncbi:MAG: polyphosphate kinase 1 [Ectothiorhodospiraceae bacterium]|nr:polyphosphate kinase 1 [Ectothiorhodospiraceae bacterium]